MKRLVRRPRSQSPRLPPTVRLRDDDAWSRRSVAAGGQPVLAAGPASLSARGSPGANGRDPSRDGTHGSSCGRADLFFLADAIGRLTTLSAWTTSQEITPAAFRDAVGTTRKFAIPLLQYFDHAGVTVRIGETRRLKPIAPPARATPGMEHSQ